MKEISFCVIVATKGRLQLLIKMLMTLEQNWTALNISKQGARKFVLKICVNGDDPETLDFITNFKTRSQFEIEIVSIGSQVTPASARNLLLNAVSEDWVVFLDDDVQLGERFLINLVNLIEMNPEIDVWGGPNITSEKSSFFQKENGWLLAQRIVTGPVSQRYRLSGKGITPGGQFNLMLCNLVVRRVHLAGVLFKPVFKTAEENEILYRLKDNGAKAATSDLLYVFHERRNSRMGFLRQIYYYGYGRGQLFFEYEAWKQGLFIAFPLIFVVLISFIHNVWALAPILAVGSFLELKFVRQIKRLSWFVFLMPVIVPSIYFCGMGFVIFTRIAIATKKALWPKFINQIHEISGKK